MRQMSDADRATDTSIKHIVLKGTPTAATIYIAYLTAGAVAENARADAAVSIGRESKKEWSMPKKKHNQAWYKEEKQIVSDLKQLGYSARRQPGSGNKAIDLQDDVVWRDSPAGHLQIEAKWRDECRWKTLEGWRAGADILTVRCHAGRTGQNGERMAFLSWKLLLELVGQAKGRIGIVPPEQGRCEIPHWAEQWIVDSDRAKACRKAVQTTYTPPPKREKPQPRKLQGRKFRKAT